MDKLPDGRWTMLPGGTRVWEPDHFSEPKAQFSARFWIWIGICFVIGCFGLAIYLA